MNTLTPHTSLQRALEVSAFSQTTSVCLCWRLRALWLGRVGGGGRLVVKKQMSKTSVASTGGERLEETLFQTPNALQQMGTEPERRGGGGRAGGWMSPQEYRRKLAVCLAAAAS